MLTTITWEQTFTIERRPSVPSVAILFISLCQCLIPWNRFTKASYTSYLCVLPASNTRFISNAFPIYATLLIQFHQLPMKNHSNSVSPKLFCLWFYHPVAPVGVRSCYLIMELIVRHIWKSFFPFSANIVSATSSMHFFTISVCDSGIIFCSAAMKTSEAE